MGPMDHDRVANGIRRLIDLATTEGDASESEGCEFALECLDVVREGYQMRLDELTDEEG